LAEIGYADAVITRECEDGALQLIDGHLRAETTPDMMIPCLVTDLDEAEAKKLLLTLDPLGAMAEASRGKLEDLLHEVQTSSEDLAAMLTGLAEENGIIPKADRPWDDPGQVSQLVDRPEELATKWKTAPGQLWIVGEHRLLCGDSTNADDVRRLMNGQKACLMATDPYMVDYHGGNHPRSLSNSELVKDRHSADYQEAEDPAFYGKFLSAALEHALNDRPALYVWHAYKKQAFVEDELSKAGVLVHQQIIWVKSRAVLTHSHFMYQHEPCFYGWKSGNKPEKRPPANVTTVWQIGQQDFQGIHPTEKPLEIFCRPIEYHTDQGDLVYEPFSGSGAQLVSAQSLNRRCYGMEKSPAFVACAIERLADLGLEPHLEVTDGPPDQANS
jgi:DNA modification methylase